MSSRLSPTLILIAVNVAFYIYTSLLGQNFIVTANNVLAIYGQYTYAILYRGYWWQLVTSMFVHVNIAHMAGNMFFLLIFGMRARNYSPTLNTTLSTSPLALQEIC